MEGLVKTLLKPIAIAAALALPSALIAQGSTKGGATRAPERQESRGTVVSADDSAATPAEGSAVLRRVPIAKAPFGDAVVIINARSDGQIEVAAAGAKRSNIVAAPWRSARFWADSAARLVATRARPKKGETLTSRAALDEPGVAGGAISLTRKTSRDTTEWSLFFADTAFGGFAVPIERSEAAVFAATIRRAAVKARELQAPPKRAAVKAAPKRPSATRPAAKAEPKPQKTPAPR